MLKVYIEYIFNDDIIPFIYDDVIDITFNNSNSDITFTYLTIGGLSTRVLKKNKIHIIRIESTNFN